MIRPSRHDPLARRRPPLATLAVTAAMLLIGVATLHLSAFQHAEWVARLGFDLDALRSLRVWTLPVATLFQADPGLRARFFFLLTAAGVGIALVELRAGSRLALVAFFVGDWLASLVKLALLAIVAGFGSTEAEAFLHTPDTGSSAAATSAFTVAAFVYRGRPRLLLMTGLTVWLVYGLLFFHLDVSIVHVGGALGGAAIGAAWRHHSATHRITAATDSSALRP